MVGVSIEVIIEGIIFQGFQEGYVHPGHGYAYEAVPCTVHCGYGRRRTFPYRLFENDNAGQEREMDDETFFRMMKQNNPPHVRVCSGKHQCKDTHGYDARSTRRR